MKFGMLHLFESPENRSEAQMIDEQLSLMERAEGYGFDSIWPAEHHFTEYGVCGSPALNLAAVARTTTKIRLGTGVVVLPLHNPVRVAEDFAMLDQLSGGRVDFGIGRGYQPIEFQGFGVDQTKSREMFDESIEIIRRAWTEEKLSFRGKHYQFEDLQVRPRPLQDPHPPIWMAALSEETFEKAGRLGFNLLLSPLFGGSLQVARDRIQVYREALASAGFDPASRQVGALTMVFTGKNHEEAREQFAGPVIWYFRTFGKFVAPKVGQPAIEGYEWYTEIRDLASKVEWSTLLEHGAVICGETSYVTEQLRELKETTGIDHLLGWTRLGGLADELVTSHMENMRDEVMPELR
ncbi:MAG: LLM class flavin-dependent oxidoreductase [bacterium]|nr:LLM class flavin-dependent oxidoreductase [bacterium]MCP5065408.1 LLM class flavin-dependent oxidoreductase [bacterium]